MRSPFGHLRFFDSYAKTASDASARVARRTAKRIGSASALFVYIRVFVFHIASLMNVKCGITHCNGIDLQADVYCIYFNFIFSSSLWSIYGHARECSKLVQVNLVGLFLMCGYVTVFYYYTLKKALVVKQSAANAFIFCLVLFNLNEIRFKNHLGRHNTSRYLYSFFFIDTIHIGCIFGDRTNCRETITIKLGSP